MNADNTIYELDKERSMKEGEVRGLLRFDEYMAGKKIRNIRRFGESLVKQKKHKRGGARK